jgi:CRP-like cAMP-binding protein
MVRPDQSNARNEILSSLSAEDFGRLSPRLQPVDLPFKQTLIVPDEPIRHVYFPDQGVASMLALLEGGGSVEVGMISREGMVGIHVFLGVDTVTQECVVQIPGTGWRMEVAAFREAAVQSRSLSASLHRYTMTFLLQVSQTAACNASHQLDERLARWLLMTHDRTDGDQLPLTHEYLSIMLAVRRSGVTIAASALQKAGIIRYTSGHITILNREALEMSACECYRTVKDQTDFILGNKLRIAA